MYNHFLGVYPRVEMKLVFMVISFYSLNPSMYYSIAITVMEKVHIDIHPRKKREKKKSGFNRLFIRQYDYFRM